MRTRRALLLTGVLIHTVAVVIWANTRVARTASPGPASAERTGGELVIRGKDGNGLGNCPLKFTDVRADVVGYVSRVTVKQTFHNPMSSTIEAVYIFPLPEGSAVDEMVMHVGDRRIIGKIKEKEEARRTYETAKAAGHVAGLLDQQRPNIFTQRVANLAPGAEVTIEIKYVETLKYENGVFEFVFPTVVGPRYIPGTETKVTGWGTKPDTDRVPDASQITPPVAPRDKRAGHDIKLTVNIDAGMPVRDIKCEQHDVDVYQADSEHAVVTLRNEDEIPNRDFILRYSTASDRIQEGFFAHRDNRGGYFTLVLEPPKRVAPRQAVPKEMVFVIDCSGSMYGFPIEKAKEAMKLCIEQMNPRDTFNLISFSGGTGKCFREPVPNTIENRAKALRYLGRLEGGGGTEMMPAIMEALSGHPGIGRLRVVCFMSDGYVGNDFEIIEAVKRCSGTARVFPFGIGTSVNRFLIEGMAHAGRGESEFITLEADGSAAAKRFQERIQSPVLTDIRIDWGELPVDEVYPRLIPDLFSEKPIMIHGRLRRPGAGTIALQGYTAAGPYRRVIQIDPGVLAQTHEALPSLWARAKVKDLMMRDMAGLQAGAMRADLKQAITSLGLQYRLMTQFTSFVAVEDKAYTPTGPSTTVVVPVDMPRGVSHEGVFGDAGSMMVQSRAGDPLIRVHAPASARHVIALLPGGDIKRLTWNEKKARWEARFDIPTHASEGDYFITVIVVLEDGTRSQFMVRYRVDTTPPSADGAARTLDDTRVHLEVSPSEDAARATAILPWDRTVEMRRSPEGNRFTAVVDRPDAFRGRDASVTIIVTDRAHNRTQIVLDLGK